MREQYLYSQFSLYPYPLLLTYNFRNTPLVYTTKSNTESILGASVDTTPTLVVPNNANSYQSASDSADSPITSPTTTPSSPQDHLINGNVASPSSTSNVLIMRDITSLDEPTPYSIAFKEEPMKEEQHTF